MSRATHLLLLALCALAVLSATAATPAEDGVVPARPHVCGYDTLAKDHDLTPETTVTLLADDEVHGNATYEAVYRASSGSYAAIRIGVFFSDLDDSSKYCTSASGTAPDFQGSTVACDSDSILTSSKKTILKTKLVPDAIQLHVDRLKVQPVTSAFTVPTYTGSICGQFTVPASHKTSGVSGYDFVLYVAAGPTSGNTIAWATTCSVLSSTGRPLIGVSNISPKYIADDHNTIRVVAHEILHAMGFSETYFDKAGMTSTATIRKKSSVPVVTSSRVVSAAKEQYGCNSLTNMELEDGGGSGTAGSHWKRRNAKDELMAGISSYGYYTALTIAAMEDLGYYQGDYSKAELMPWGLDAGCSLMSDMCMTNKVSLDTSMFCTDSTSFTCTAARDAVGSCQIEDSATPPSWAANYGYFNSEDTMDYCPYVLSYSNTGCTDGSIGVLPNSKFGSTSRCLDASSGRAVCAAIVCSTSTYTVQFSSGDAVDCTPGKTVTIPGTSRKVTCPQHYEVCDEYCSENCKPSGALAMVATGCSGVLVVLVAVLMAVVA